MMNLSNYDPETFSVDYYVMCTGFSSEKKQDLDFYVFKILFCLLSVKAY